MKSRLEPAVSTFHQRRLWRYFWVAAIILIGVAGAAFAQEQGDPPSRVGYVSYRQGGVVFAPEGDEEWTDLPANRPLTAGDRLWTDRGARAELQIGTSTLHVDGESHLGVSDLDERALKVILQQGSLNLRVREVLEGENIEVDTPNLAFRAMQPGDYRIDVDPRGGETRVTVQSGLGSIFGEGGESIQMGANQNASFAGRFLAQVQGPEYRQDDFGLWAADRNRAEDESVAARYVPRGVVGYSQLDPYGTWGEDPNLGPVWYPTVQVANWAPYRYGNWTWIDPWGWTWVDDAPWGFAPFHYGRWTMIGSRWAWAPGRMHGHARPVYSPAMVAFLGGSGTRLAVGGGPAVGWYPLAPGEAWWPAYHHSQRYVSRANGSINLATSPRNGGNHLWRGRPFAVTAMGEEDFRRGRPVFRHWQSLPPQTINHAQLNVVPGRPEPRPRGDGGQRPGHPFATAPAGAQPGRFGQSAQPAQPTQSVQPAMAPRFSGGREAPPAMRDQARAQREQGRLQRDAERAAREQQRQAEATRLQQDPRAQREQLFRQQQQTARLQEQAARIQQERAQREAWHLQRDPGGVPAVRPQVQAPHPFVQAAPQQVVPVPQQQVRPVQQPQAITPVPRVHNGERAWQAREPAPSDQPTWQGQAQGQPQGGWQGHQGGGGGGWQREGQSGGWQQGQGGGHNGGGRWR